MDGAIHLQENSRVVWQENGIQRQGEIQDLYCVRMVIRVGDRVLVKEGSLENPALLIYTEEGHIELLLYSEMEEVFDISLHK